jgi:hypothetical protein
MLLLLPIILISNWEVLKCGAEEGQRRSVGQIVSELMY